MKKGGGQGPSPRGGPFSLESFTHVTLRLAYLHLTLVPSKGQGQGHDADQIVFMNTAKLISIAVRWPMAKQITITILGTCGV